MTDHKHDCGCGKEHDPKDPLELVVCAVAFNCRKCRRLLAALMANGRIKATKKGAKK